MIKEKNIADVQKSVGLGQIKENIIGILIIGEAERGAYFFHRIYFNNKPKVRYN